MKEYIKKIISIERDRQYNLNVIREYLQRYILYILHTKKFLRQIIFTGGTALRILYGLKRFSEDLDFSLSGKDETYDFLKTLNTLKRELEQSGYVIDVAYSDKKVVHNAYIKFPGLFHEFGLSSLRDEKLSIRLEIDTNPPQGGATEITLHDSVFMFHILHYDIASLFTGKLNAILARKYTKGRDYYDLIWYLTKFKDIQPNLTLLNNGLNQAREKFESMTAQNWRVVLMEKVEKADMKKIVRDVEPLLENQSEIDLLKKDVIRRLILPGS